MSKIKLHHIKLFEDWGSSDWYSVKSTIERSIKNGSSFDEAAEDASEWYFKEMGCTTAGEALAKINSKFYELKDKK